MEHNVPKKIIKNCNRKKIKINIHNKHGLSGVMNCSNMKFNLKNYTLEKLNSFNCAKFKTTPTIQRKRWKIDFYIPGCSIKLMIEKCNANNLILCLINIICIIFTL